VPPAFSTAANADFDAQWTERDRPALEFATAEQLTQPLGGA